MKFTKSENTNETQTELIVKAADKDSILWLDTFIS